MILPRAAPAAALLALALAATPAWAHGALPGGGGFYAGFLHPFLALEHLLLLAALGLLLGRQPRKPAEAPLALLAVGLGAGLALGAAGAAWPGAPSGVLAATALTGTLLALAAPVPALGAAALAAAAGLGIGLDTGVPIPAAAAAFPWAPYAGVLLGVFLIALNAMALASLAQRPPWTIGLRILGSWLAAAAVMVLALHLRRAGAP